MPRMNRSHVITALTITVALLVIIVCFSVSADSTPQTLPFSQNWTNTGLITTDDNWAGVPGVIGYRGDDITTVTGTDPQTLLSDGTTTPVDVIANLTVTTNATGGIQELEITDPTIAFHGSGTATR